MYARSLKLPPHSFFLFGPRGTGKTTWLKSALGSAKWFDLLRNRELLRLMRNPDQFRFEVQALKKGAWIVVDEVQKYPSLLNEIHSLIADYEDRYRFAISGSSARKLKRLDANLLAGRVINRKFFPLTGAELNYDFNSEHLLCYGTLPQILSKPKLAVDLLEAYVANYIKEEIQQEALVKNLDSFSRFLEVSALMNGQIVNVANVARDAGVARPTVKRYFETLVDTLVGVWLPAWRPRAKVKETSHPKFYFFDTGVVRTLAGRIRDPIESIERGFLLETLVLHELRAWHNVSSAGGQLCYWRTPSQSEVDFVWSRGGRAVGMEVKASKQWKRGYGNALKELISSGQVEKGCGVYLGEQLLKDGPLKIFPLKMFMQHLNRGRLF